MNGRIVLCIVLVGAALSSGCVSHPAAPEPTQVLCPEGITTAQIIEAAHDVLADMHFSFEKLDVERGFVQTRPLRSGQFFEFWRSDNVGAFNTIEANVQSIRRIVGLRVTTEAPDALSPSPVASGLRIECDVQVQRLALPGNEIAGISQAYMMHTHSEATMQVLDVTPQQRAGMTWIDLGPDAELAAKILRRIEKKLED